MITDELDHAGPPPGASADWTIPQRSSGYTDAEHAMWDRLFARQAAMLPERVVPAFIDGPGVLRMSKPGIPDFDGAGIVSSHGESVFALGDPSPNRLSFDLKRLMLTKYRIDDCQRKIHDGWVE